MGNFIRNFGSKIGWMKVVVCIFLGLNLNAQTTIYSENFSTNAGKGNNAGTTNFTGVTTWSINTSGAGVTVSSGDFFYVNNSRFELGGSVNSSPTSTSPYETSKACIWNLNTGSGLDISNYRNVSVTFTLGSTASHSSKHILAQISMDGTNYLDVGLISASISANTITVSNLVGSTLYFRILAFSGSSTGVVYLDDVVVKGYLGKTTQTFSSGTGSFSVPTNVYNIGVYAWGGGGGGGSTNTGSFGGGGGGGGAFAYTSLTVSPSQTCYYSVGQGGSGATYNNTSNASNGGNSWLNCTNNAVPSINSEGVLAIGGSAASNSISTSQSMGASGGSAGSSVGTIKKDGATGGNSSSSGGGGGGASGTIVGTTSLNSNTLANGTVGSSSDVSGGKVAGLGGDGGTGEGSDNSSPGGDGVQPGGGGGGSDDNFSNSGFRGGAGGAGQIIIVYYTQSYYSNNSSPNTDANNLSNWNSERDGSGTAPSNFSTSANFYVQNGHKYQLTANLTGGSTGNFTVEDGGALDLNGKTLSTWSSLTINGAGVSSSGALLNSNATAASHSIPTTLGSNSTINSSTGNITLSGIVSGAYSLTKSGSASLILSGNNTYSGGTTLSAGTLAVGHNSALGTGTLTISGGNLDASGADRTITNAISVSGNFGFTGTYNLTQNTGAVSLSISPTITVSANNLTINGIIANSGTTATTYSTPGNFTWNRPTGVTSATVYCWGGGGGGSASWTSSGQGSRAGGGGGTIAFLNLTNLTSSSYYYTVGAGGSGGTVTSAGVYTNGGNGGSSYFGNTSSGNSSGALVLATGGGYGTASGGTSSTASNTGTSYSGGTGGLGGSYTCLGCPATNCTTGNGDTFGGGGGGGGGSSSNGGSPSGACSGSGGSGTYAGGSGGYGQDHLSGTAGSQPGGGGAGAANGSGTTPSGGAGGDGQIIITYTTPRAITKSGAGTLTFGGVNTFSGGLTITAGSVVAAVANAIPVYSTGFGVTLSGGTLSSGASSGYSQGVVSSTNMGVLTLSSSSTIALGTGGHNLFFSSGTFTGGQTLTINGWTGTAGSSGTAGKIFVGSDASGLGSTELAQISFTGYSAGASILSTGEIVPKVAPTITTTGTLNTFTACTGVNSAEQSFTVSGTFLTNDISISAPTGYEISTTSGSSFGSSLSLTQTSGSVSTTTIYVRTTTSATNGASGNVSCTSTGATQKDIATGSATINSNNTITLSSAAGTTSQTPCINTAITNITYATTGATGASFSGLPSGVSGSWSGNVVTITGTPTASGNNSYTVTMTGGCTGGTNTATGSINVSDVPTTSNAGSAIEQCNTSSFTLAGNNPTTGTGLWTVTSGSATITTPSSYNSGVTGVSAGSSATLTWTISNGTCSASTSTVTLTNYATPTTSNAGSAIEQCNTSSFTLAGNNPTTGTGLWTVTSGTATITTPSAYNSGVTGVSAGTSATLTWTISNGTCSASTSTVTLTNYATPTTSNAGSAIEQCNTSSFTLAGNNPTTGTGLWTVTSGSATITTPSSYNSGVTGVSAGSSATLTWTISNGTCSASTSTVTLTNYATPTTSNAGSAINQCNTSSFTLAGNNPTTGTGLWTVTSGSATITTPSSYNSGVTGVSAGTNATLTWTISNGTCSASTSTVTLTNYATPTTSNAGSAIEQCNTSSFTLAGNNPTTGTGLWTVTSGTATITTPSSYNSGVTGVSAGSSATLTWTISNGTCSASTSTVTLTNYATPTTSNAGSAINQCNTSSFTLAGNNPTTGTGLWTVTSGTTTITTPSSYNSEVTGVSAGTSATLTWTISNGTCSASTSTVTLTNNPLPTLTTSGTITSVTENASAQTSSLTYTASTNSPTSYSIDWASGITDQTSTAHTFQAGGSSISDIAITAGVVAGTYSGTITFTTAAGCSGTQAVSVVISSGVTTFYFKGSGNMNDKTSWSSDSNGSSGTEPTTMSTNGYTFNVYHLGGNATPSLNGTWTLGTGSKIVVGNGTNAVNFTVPYTITGGQIDVSNNATLTISSTTNPTLGTLNSGSSIVYAGSSAQNLPTGASIPRLTINNTNGVTVSGNSTISNTLTLSLGKLIVPSNTTLSLGTASSDISLSTGDATSYIACTDTTSKILRYVNNNATLYTFPMGDASSYTPMTLNFISGANGGSKYITTSVKNTVAPGFVSANFSNYIKRYWLLYGSGFTNGNYKYNITYKYVDSDLEKPAEENTLIPVKRSGSTWYKPRQATRITNGTVQGSGSVTIASNVCAWDSLTTFSFDMAAGDEAAALPIHLLYFTAKPQTSRVRLDWATASETNNDYFTVERSSDGEQFNELFKKPGAGISTTNLYYFGYDNKPLPGISYYRLKQTDYDGKFAYSDVESVSLYGSDRENTMELKIYPNPAENGKFHLSFDAKQSEKYSISIYDAVGKLIYHQDYQAEKGINDYTIELPDLASGIYQLEVKNDNVGVITKSIEF